MNKKWLGLISLGLGLLIFCANSTTDLSFFPKLYLTLFVSKAAFLVFYFSPGFFQKIFSASSYDRQPLRLPRFK